MQPGKERNEIVGSWCIMDARHDNLLCKPSSFNIDVSTIIQKSSVQKN